MKHKTEFIDGIFNWRKVNMKCSVCGENASYLLYHYTNNRCIEFVEARCSLHFHLEKNKRKQDRKNIRDMRHGKKPKYKKDREKQIQEKNKPVKNKKIHTEKKTGFWRKVFGL